MTTHAFSKMFIACHLAISTLIAADFTWNGTVSSSWQEPANWSPAGIPGPGDNVTVPSGKRTIELSDNREVASFTFNGGELSGSGTLTATSTFTWNAGTLSGTGRLFIPTGATLIITGASNKGLVGWTVQVAGLARWEGTGNIGGGQGARFQIDPAGEWQIQTDADIYHSYVGNTPVIINQGTVRKTAGTAVSDFGVPFENQGSVQIASGTLRLQRTATHSGSFDVLSGCCLEFAGGTQELGTTSSITGTGQLLVSGGTVNVNGQFNITGKTTLSSGTLNLNTDATSAGEFELTDGTLTGTGTLTHAGTFTWNGGTLSGTGALVIPAGATLVIGSASGKTLLSRTVSIAGNARWEGTGYISSGQGATVNVQPTGLFEISSDQNFYFNWGGTATVFNNAGIVRKTAATGTTTFSDVVFNNSGTLAVQAGILRLTGGGTGTGIYNVSGGATLDFGGGTHNLSSASSITGDGTVNVSSGNVTHNGIYQVTGTTKVESGQLQLLGNVTSLGSSVAVTGGTLDLRADVTVQGNGSLSSGTITGTGQLGFTGTFTWNGGTLSGTGALVIPAGATLVIGSGSGKALLSRTVSIAGNARWEGTGNISSGQGATVNVQPTGLFEISFDQNFYFNQGGTATVFNNAGIVRKTAATGTTTLGVQFDNNGRVEVITGALELYGDSTSNGSYEISKEGTLQFSGGTHDLSPSSSLTSAGTVVVAGTVNCSAELDVNGTTTISSGGTLNLLVDANLAGELKLTSGTLSSAGTLTHSGVFSWNMGTVRGTGQLVIPQGATMILSSDSGKLLLINRLSIAGTARWEGTGNISSGEGATVQIEPAGLFEIWNDANFYYGWGGARPVVRNAGTIRKAIGRRDSNSAFGSVDLQNTGTLEVDNGNLSVSGQLTQENAVLRFGLRAPSDYGQLRVFDRMPCNGTLEANLQPGFQPGAGDSFALITYSKFSGSFTNYLLPVLTNGLAWRVEYLPDRFQITAFAPSGLDRKISGTVRSTSGAPIPGAGVFAFNLESTNAISVSTITDSDGKYSLSVSNGTWQVGLRNLAALGFQEVPNQMTTVSGADKVVDFVVPPLGGETFILAVSANPADGGTTTGGGSYSAGTEVTVTAIPNRTPMPYVFVNWTENGIEQSRNTAYTFTLTRNRDLVANFTLESYQVAAVNDPSNGGTVTGAGTYPYGSTCTLKATPSFGYQFTEWTENSAVIGTNSEISFTVTTNRTLTARYSEAHPFHIVTTATLPPGLAAVTGAGTYTNGQTTTISAPAAVTNAPPDYYTFKRLTLNGNYYGTSPTFQKTFATTDPTNMHFVAEYEFQDRTPPVLSQIKVEPNVASATISFITDEPARAKVEYGLTTAYGSTNEVAGYRTSHSVTLTGLAPATLYHCRVRVTDVAGNETISTDHTYTTLAAPDLVPGLVTLPGFAQAGALVPMSFVISNIGPGTAFGPWDNSILVSANPDGSAAQSLGVVTFTPGPDGLAPGAAITVTQQVIVPRAGTGPLYFGVALDSGNRLSEVNETNNTAFATSPLSIAVADLAVTRLTAPPTAVFGQSFNVQCVVTNSGTAPANVPWVDRLYLSASSNSMDKLLATIQTPLVPMAPGAAYTNSLTVRIPLDASSAPGTCYLLVMVDAQNALSELNETNNLSFVPITLSMPPLPDLAVGNLLAPANLLPGQLVSLFYTLTNLGTATAGPTWSETVYVATNRTGAGAVELLTLNFTDSLATNQTIVRTQTFVFPPISLTGELWFAVKADSRDVLIEPNKANNFSAASTPTYAPRALTFELSVDRIREDASQPIKATVRRNGDASSALVVTLNNSDPSEVVLPSSVTIPERQSHTTFDISPVADGRVDGPQTVAVIATADGFEPAVAQITVLDVDLPRLTLTLADNSPTEGETVVGIVSRDSGTDALQVTLSCSSSAQVMLPPSVVIPSGQAQTMFEIAIADDILIEPALTVGLQATASGYQPGSASLTLQDNDWPDLRLEIEPSVFSEGAGPQAAMARLIRNPVTPRPVEVDLVNSNTNAVQVPRTVTIPGGEAEVRFAIAAVDNNMVDGDKQGYIDPWFKAHILGTRLGKGTTARVIVRDDDGPTLTLTANRRIVAEGLSPAATLTLSRNTGTNTALVVHLASDNTQELVLQPTVTLAEGVWSVNVPVNSVNDGVSDGNKTVTVTASAEGFTAASVQLIVTDVDMPDLVVRSVQAPIQAETESYIDIGYQIYNQGLANATSNSVIQRVYLSRDPIVGDDVLVGQFAFNGPLPTGAHFGQTIPVRLPRESGNYWVVVQADSTDAIVETIEDNNSTVSSDPIRVVPAYTAVVSTPVDKALAGSPVPMTGSAIKAGGGPAQFALVSIHIRVRDTVRTIAALTDANGQFATTWQPLQGEAGYYEICAAHPGEPIPNPQDSFYLLGMKATPAEPFVSVIAGDTATGSVNVANLSGLPLGGLEATVTDQPPNVQATVTISTNVLAGNGTAKLEYSIAANDASYTSGLIRIVVTSAEGAALEVPLRVAVTPRVPRLVAMPDRLEAGVQRGTQRTIPIKLVNTGGLNSGPITVSLPPVSWMGLATPNPMNSLAPGETNTILLQLMPGLDIQPGVHSGNLALNTPNTGLGVPFSIRILSEATGALLVNTSDEFTYYATGSPPLTNATVRVLDAVDRTILTNGVTDTQGRFFLQQLREGYYTVEVEAEKHNRYESTILLEPGVTNTIDAFLPYQAVRYTWTVEKIEIEDRYRITVETEFETFVPVPVITVDPPVLDLSDLKLVGQTRQVNMTFRNHGLIAANHLRLVIDKHAYYSIEPLITDLGTLPAKSSLTIPVVLRRIGPAQGLHAAPKPRASGAAACTIAAVSLYDYLCGDKNVGQQTPIPITGVDGECEPLEGLPPMFTDIAPRTPSGPGDGDSSAPWTSVVFAPPSIDIHVPDLCVLLCWIKAIASCPPITCPFNIAGCLVSKNLLQCLKAARCVSKLLSLESCIKNIVKCSRSTFGGGSAPPHSRAGLAGTSPSDPGKFYLKGVWLMADLFNLITGSSDDVWLGSDHDPNASAWFDRFFAATDTGSDKDDWITDSERANLLTGDLPTTVPVSELVRIIERWNRTMENIANGIYSPEDAPPGANLDFIDMLLVEQKLTELLEYFQAAQAAGYDDPIQALIENGKMALEEPGTAGVCARIKLKLDQQAVLSREAFRATLEINNETADPLDHIGVDLQITDSARQPAENLFDIRPPELSNLNDVYGLGLINPGQKSTARWVIVPTVDAAPTAPTRYYIGGVFRYTLNGTEFVVPMVPVPITVNPSARLNLHYFHQRDVFSDDPFTDIVEPSIPFNLAVMVHNWGAGTARNFRITSAQPEIVDNEKGLLIDFKIIATEVAGQNMTPTLTADFGDIMPGQMKIARWLMTSTLQGLFINYSATFEHLDGRGNPRLSIIDKLDIHELIHMVQAGGAFEDGKPDFLVNDRPDSLDLPDTLWLSDGSSNAVAVVTNAIVTGTLSPANLQVQLSAPMPPGWAYLRVPDPADGRYQLADILRSDGARIAIQTNAWVTDRTFLGMGKPPKREHVLHLLDHDSTGQYTLRYESLPAPDTEPPTSMVDALPAQSRPAFLVRWSGQDNPGGTGISSYDVFYSENGGPFIRWLYSTPNTSAVFQGALGSTYAFYSVAVDVAGNRQPTPAAPQAQTTVALENHPPVFTPQPNVALNEGDTLSIIAAATDPDGDALTYKLGPGVPTGLNLNNVSGSLTWVTSEAHGPSTNKITLIAQDSGIPAMTATQQFSVIVLEVNSPPTLQPIPDQRIYEGTLLSINCSASDSDLPQQKLFFALGDGAPPGAAIDANTGVFTWRPTEFQGGTNYQILVVVRDDWTPPLTATQAFNVVVLDNMPDFRLSIGTAAVLPGENGTVPLTLKSGAELKQIELHLSINGDRLTQLQLTNLAPQVGSATLLPLPTNEFLLQFIALANSAFQGQFTLGHIGFNVTSDPHSGIAVLQGERLEGLRLNGLTIRGRPSAGRVYIVGDEPILAGALTSSQQLALTLYAQPTHHYIIERTQTLEAPDWQFDSLVWAASLQTDLPLRQTGQTPQFFRAQEAQPGSTLNIYLEPGHAVIEWLAPCDNCVLQQSDRIGQNANWATCPVQPVLQSGHYRVSVPITGNRQFYRLVQQSP